MPWRECRRARPLEGVFRRPEQSLTDGMGSGFGAVPDVEFGEDVARVVVYCAFGEVKLGGNFFIGGTICGQSEHRDLPFGKVIPCRYRLRGPIGTAELSQYPGGHPTGDGKLPTNNSTDQLTESSPGVFFTM